MEFMKAHRTQILSISGLCLLAIFFLFILIEMNPNAYSHIPILSAIASVVTSDRTGTSASTLPAAEKQGNSFTAGISQGGSEQIVPVSGTALSPKGGYNDGKFTGDASEQTGLLILKITIASGKLTDITFLTLPSDANQAVLTALAKEAISGQVVEVSPITNYDSLSVVFQKALSSAIQKSFKT